MGLFGGSKSSSTTNQSETTFANYGSGGDGSSQNFNLSGVSQGKNSTLTIETSDYGAIDAGAKLASEALNYVGEANSRAVQALQSTSQSVIDKTLKIAGETQVSEGAQLQRNLIYAAIIGAIAFVLVKVVK